MDASGIKQYASVYLIIYLTIFQGLMAIYSPETGIVDFAQVTRSYASDFLATGGKIHTNFLVSKFQMATEGSEYPVLIFDNKGTVSTNAFLSS